MISKWKWEQWEQSVLQWMAGTVTGSLFKVALVPVILWVGDQAGGWDIPAVLQVALIAVVPALVNILNPQDTRYGMKAEGLE